MDKSPFRDSCYVTQVVSMNDNFWELTSVACRILEDYNEVMEWAWKKNEEQRAKHEVQSHAVEDAEESSNHNVKDLR